MLTKELFSLACLSRYNIQKDFDNMKSLHSFYNYEDSMASDGFIHLLAQGNLFFSCPCKYALTFLPCFHLFYIYEGTLTVTSDGVSSRCEANSVSLFPCGAETIYKTDGKCHFFEAAVIGLPLALYSSVLCEPILYKKETAGASILWAHISFIEKLQNISSVTDVMKISKWLTDILTELCVFCENSVKKKDNVPAYLLAIKAQMDQNYAEPLSLDELEHTYKISRYRICREFSHHYGQSPMHYLNSRRILIAKKLLLTTDLTIREVGSKVGIDNTNHFINLFKKDTGTTPLSFKQAAPVSVSDLHYS